MAACLSSCSLFAVSPAVLCATVKAGSLKSQGCSKSMFGSSLKLTNSRFAGERRWRPATRAVQEEAGSTETATSTQKIIADLQAKWDTVEDKPSVFVFTGGALVTLWLSSAILGAFESVPFMPKLFQLVGLGYTTWFVYRYLLFTPNRQELKAKFGDLVSQITGSEKA